MSIRGKITFTCDKCGKKVIEYFGSQCSGDPVRLPLGWKRFQRVWLEVAHHCDDCTAHLEMIDAINQRAFDVLDGICGDIWGGRNALVTDHEGS